MSAARGAYSALWYLLGPLLRRYLRRRGRAAPAYLQHWDERFGASQPGAVKGAIWVHAVSVGETRAAQPLIAALRERYPDAPLLLTQMTPTGRATAEALYPDAAVRYLPYDRPDWVRRFVAEHAPRCGVLMETELWPNLIHACAAAGVPLWLANARLSDKSLRGYQRISALIRPALQKLTGIAAQTEADAARLRALGATAVTVCGNTKYDIAAPAAQRALGAEFRRWLGERPVVVAASTRDGEEALLLDAWAAARPNATLVIVPRHPERFAEVAALVTERGLSLARRSDTHGALGAPVDVWLGDSMGEMFAYYAAAELAFVGGSLLPLGGQNLIEPASLGVPVLHGPSMFNFTQAADAAGDAGAARQCADAPAVVSAVVELLQSPLQRQQMAAAAQAFATQHRGASQRIAALVAGSLAPR